MLFARKPRGAMRHLCRPQAVVALLTGMFWSGATLACEVSCDDRVEGSPPRPPQVAIDACQGLAVDTACRFVGRRGDTISGQCFVAPDETLACRPEHPPRDRFRGRESAQERPS